MKNVLTIAIAFTLQTNQPKYNDRKRLVQTKIIMAKRGNQRWSPRGRPWPPGRPRGQILKSLALASKVKSLALASSPRKLACPRLEDSTIF